MKFQLILLLLLATFLPSCGGSSSNSGSNTTPTIENRCNIVYPKQSTSLYVLPYTINSAFNVGQGNCTDGSHTLNTEQAFAYDFDMPIGTNVIASRSGIVIVVVENYLENNNIPGQENYLVIQHNDDTVSIYYHLTHNGVAVKVGDSIVQGELLARSGNTGDSSAPHLHFEVALCEDCQTLPISFKNTREHINGLVEGEVYLAE